jgi:hypothetical protein
MSMPPRSSSVLSSNQVGCNQVAGEHNRMRWSQVCVHAAALMATNNSVLLQDLALQSEGHPKLQDGIVAASVHIHQSVESTSHHFFNALRRHTYVTPTSYLELLNTFIRLLAEKRAAIETTRMRLAVGLDKLLTTAEQVAEMQKELVELQPVLERTALEVEEMMAQIAVDKEAAAATKATVQVQEAAANEKAASAKAIAADAQVHTLPCFLPCVCLNFLATDNRLVPFSNELQPQALR